jgi:hypothetical protein
MRLWQRRPPEPKAEPEYPLSHVELVSEVVAREVAERDQWLEETRPA